MDTRRLFSSTVMYGFADVIVLAVGGFLLLPLYTRALSQSEFGAYVIFRTNTEILTYLLFLGLPSAVSRVYFDHKKQDTHIEYLSSVATFFLLNLLVVTTLLSIWGPGLWALLSPATPAEPLLAFSLAIAAVGFFAALGPLWLRMEGRAAVFAALQLATSAVLAAIAVFNLVVLKAGLPGLLSALLVSSAFSAMALPWMFGRRFCMRIRWTHITESLPYAVPALIGYAAYFVLNRTGTLILQRHVASDQIAIFGLAQQLAMMVAIAAAAFGKASQPAVFAAEPMQAAELMRSSGKILILLMFCVTSILVLFSSEIFSLVAPKSYAGGQQILVILLVANFAYSFTQVSDTALLYHRRPKSSVAVSLAGAGIAAALSALLVPHYLLYGAAVATVGAFIATALLSHWIAQRSTGHNYHALLLPSLAAIVLLAVLTDWLGRQSLPVPTALALKVVGCALILFSVYRLAARKLDAIPCNP